MKPKKGELTMTNILIGALIGFLIAWNICGIILYLNDNKIMCPDMMFYILSLPIQIISTPYYLIKYCLIKKKKS